MIYKNLNISYKEKTIWLSLGLTVYLMYYYYSGLNTLNNTNTLTEASFSSLLTTSVIWLTSLAIAFHIIVAAINHREAEQDDDERDKLIEMISTRNAYYILVLGILVAISQTQFSHFNYVSFNYESLSSGYNVIHYIIVSFLIAEIVKNLSQLFYYRRGF